MTRHIAVLKFDLLSFKSRQLMRIQFKLEINSEHSWEASNQDGLMEFPGITLTPSFDFKVFQSEWNMCSVVKNK
jgi:hypothetical protein